jgi:hypothetical protein
MPQEQFCWRIKIQGASTMHSGQNRVLTARTEEEDDDDDDDWGESCAWRAAAAACMYAFAPQDLFAFGASTSAAGICFADPSCSGHETNACSESLAEEFCISGVFSIFFVLSLIGETRNKCDTTRHRIRSANVCQMSWLISVSR